MTCTQTSTGIPIPCKAGEPQLCRHPCLKTPANPSAYGKFWRCGLSLFIAVVMIGCGGPEARKKYYFEKAQALQEAGDFIKARLEYKNALQIDPDFQPAYFALGVIELDEKNYKKAYKYLSKAAELDPNHLPSQIYLARLFYIGRAYDRAAERVDAVLAAEPENPEGLLIKAALQLAAGEDAPARNQLEILRSRGITDPQLYLMLATIYARQGDLKTSESILLDGIAVNPGSTQINMALAKLYTGSNRLEAAVAALQRVLAVEPENYQHYLNIAALFWDNDRKSSARWYIQQLLDKKQEPEANIIHAARFYIQKNSMKDAEEILQKGIGQFSSSFDLHLLLSEIYVNTGRSHLAIELLRRCLTFSQNPAAPGIVRTKIALAKIHLMNRELQAAEAYINEVTAEVASSIDAHYLKGIISLSKGEGFNAVSEFRTVINEKPEFIEGYIHLSQAHVLNREYALAEDTLRRALRMTPDSIEAAIALTRLHIMQGDTTAARRQLDEILEKNPDAILAVALMGDLLWARNDLRGAERQYRRLLSLAPDQDLGYRKLSRFYRNTGQLQNAREILEQGLAQFETSPQLQAALIHTFFSLRRFDEALARSRQFAEQHPENALAWYLLGKSQSERQRTTEAEHSFKKALEIRPDFQAAHIDLARLYIAREDTANAVSRLEHAIELDPSDPAAHLSLGQLHYLRGETVQAIRTLEKAVEHNPQFWPALNNLAFMLSEQDGSAEALARSLDYAQRALEVRPRDPRILDTLGWIYYKLGDPNQALGLLETALQDAPDNPMINYHAGVVYLHVGNHRLARSRLETALRTTDESFPERAEARRILTEIP